MTMPNDEQQLSHCQLKLDGTPAEPDLMAALMSVEVDDTLHMPDMFTLRFHDPELELVDSDDLDVGTEVEIEAQAAAGGATRSLLVGEITAIEPEFPHEGAPILTLRGYDRSHRLHRGKRTRTFQNVSDSDLAEQIARENQLQAQVTSTRVVHDYVIQSNQTDFEFLSERARRIGFDCIVDGQQLLFRSPGEEESQPVELDYGAGLLEFRPRLTMASQFEEVVVTGWDPGGKEAISESASDGESNTSIGIDASGPQMAESAFGAAGTLRVTHRPVASSAEASALAKAICDELAGGLVQAEGVAVGNPDIAAGCSVDVTSLGDKFSGTYFVSHVRHEIVPGRSYLTHLTISGRSSESIEDLVSGGAGRRTRIDQDAAPAGLVTGIVTNNEDPLGMGRVRVQFPWLDDESESCWARLVAPMAGPDRGLFCMPEIDDEVLLAFEHGDMNRGFVVGAVWNGEDAPPLATDSALDGGAVIQRAWTTRAGNRILLDDSDGDLGITVELGDDKHRIVLMGGSSGDTGITIESDRNTIVLNSSQNTLEIDVAGDVTVRAQGAAEVEANDITVEARAGLELKGGSSISIESNGQVQVRGSQIALN